MSRIITTHHVDELNKLFEIKATRYPDNSEYENLYSVLAWADSVTPTTPRLVGSTIVFQSQPFTGLQSLNGVTTESVLAVLIDRLEQFQAGPFPCYENRLAIMHLESALDLLKDRSDDRRERGVEGTHAR